MGTPIESLMARCRPAKAVGYKRAFCNTSPVWDFKSTATLIKTDSDNDVVEGIAVRMTEGEVNALDPFEGYPTWYNREKLTLLTNTDAGSQSSEALVYPVEGQAYIQVEPKSYEEPTLLYKIACCKTIYLSRRLLSNDADTMVELDIVNACDPNEVSTFIYSLSQDDLNAL